VATVTRLVGDLDVAEEAVQEACAVALTRWPVDGPPANPRAWLVAVARRRAIDRLRRDALRTGKELAAVRAVDVEATAVGSGDDQLGLLFLCCHPALDPAVRVALTLRAVAGLTTARIAALFLLPEATVAKRLVRAKQKIREARIPFDLPAGARAARVGDVLRVITLVFTDGHVAGLPSPDASARREVAIGLARALHGLLPEDEEGAGLLALLLLTDARRPGATGPGGEPVLLEDQDRARWDRDRIVEGLVLLDGALRRGRPGPYQLWAAIAACHSSAPTAAATDWRRIVGLYDALGRVEPSPVVAANRAVAVAMVDGPAAGLALLDPLVEHPQLRSWPPLHLARADLYRRLGRSGEAIAAYRCALALQPSAPEQAFITGRIRSLAG